MKAEQYRQCSSIVLADLNTILLQKIKDEQLMADILARVDAWTSQQPVFTRLIYHYLQQYSAQILIAEGADIVDEIVHQKIVKNWQHNDAADHLNPIHETLLSYPTQDTLLILYMQILWRQTLPMAVRRNSFAIAHAATTAEQTVLLQSGLVILANGRLQVANAIYAAIFNRQWIEQQIPGLTRTVAVIDTDIEAANLPPLTTETLLAIRSTLRRPLPELKAGLPDPVLPDPVLSDTVSPDSVLSDSVLSDSVLPDSVLPDFVLSDSDSPDAVLPNAIWSKAVLPKAALFRRVLLSKQTMFAGVVVLLGALLLPQLLSSRPQPLQRQLSTHTQVSHSPFAYRPLSDGRALFDTGMEHATNGRWLAMLQQFCRIPRDSAYFIPAKQRIERWMSLYPDAIYQANTGLLSKNNKTCVLIDTVLN